MSSLSNYINELKTAEAFTKQSLVFDKQYSGNVIIQYKRARVREHVLELLPASASILELNCGTGEDALFFAGKGHRVHATDISEGMQEKLKEKILYSSLSENITTELCSFNHLATLNHKGPFDMIFSNFGGLNCTAELDKVLLSFHSLLKPGGTVSLVIIPKFCLWETLLFFKGQFKTATRRFFSSKGRKAHIEGMNFKCWYYNPGYIIKHLRKYFELVKLEGICTIVPPSYMEGFSEKHPKLYRFLLEKEKTLRTKWPWRAIGDYFIISLRKKN
jgi:ubiquinone/menaquinone biosynthesis C-methylase UbiE